ncbi:MAG: hypothetical protein V3S76_02640 [Candidatus Bipolaricaulota bacterium]
MDTRIEQLTSRRAFLACERLQRELAGHNRQQIISSSLSAAIHQSGGIILGAYDIAIKPPQLIGGLIDLPRADKPTSFCVTLLHNVRKEARNHGIGYQLRLAERVECQERGLDFISWTIDPLYGIEAHLALNKLGAIALSYRREYLSGGADSSKQGFITDQLEMEWWINSPRVSAIIDHGKPPAQFRIGFEQMEVITKTTLVNTATRRLAQIESRPTSNYLLFEIPAYLAPLQANYPELTQDWRLKTRDAFENLFNQGYAISGFVHEAGRSFHLFERTEKRTLLKDEGRKKEQPCRYN